MAYPTQTVDLNSVYTAHGQSWLKNQPTDIFYKGNPTLAMLRKKAKKLDGGRYFYEPILAGGEPVGGSYSRAEALPTTPSDPITSAVYEASFYGEPVSIFYQDEVRAGGAGARFDYVEARMEDARSKMERKLASHLMASSQAKTTDIIPLVTHISTSATLGGITVAGLATWVAQNDDTITFSSAGLDKMRNMVNDCSFGGTKRPDLIVFPQTLWEAYVDLIEGAAQINLGTDTGGGRTGDLGFPVASYQGIKCIWDRNQISTRIDFLNHDAFYLAEQSGGAWSMTDFASLHVNGQMARIAYLRWCGQTITRCRPALGSLTTVS